MSKLITVFGATGNQGGSVIESLLADPAITSEYKIRGITRDVSKPAAQKFSSKGVEMVAADLGSREDVARAVEGSHTVYLVTNYWEYLSREIEVGQGKAVTDAAKAAGVKHLIYSSVIDATAASNGRLPHLEHFNGKAEVERYIRDSGVPGTFVMAGFFMSNFFEAIRASVRKGDDGSFTFSLPVSGSKAQIPVFDAVGDTGKFVKAAIKNFPSIVGKTILAATDYLSPDQVAAEFSEVIGKPAHFAQVPEDVFKSFMPAPVAQELLETMLLLEDPGYYAGADLSESLSLLEEKPTTWKEFVQANRAKWE